MITIYFKEAKESYDSIMDMLIHYFELNNPATFWKDNNEEQCDGYRNRSVDDLLLLANNYFPETSHKTILKAISDINKENRSWVIISTTCTGVGRHVFFKYMNSIKNNLIENTPFYFDNNCISYQKEESFVIKPKNSEFTKLQLIDMIMED